MQNNLHAKLIKYEFRYSLSISLMASVWEWSDDTQHWVEFEDNIKTTLEFGYISNSQSITYSTTGTVGVHHFSVNFFKYDGWKVNCFGVASPMRRLFPPPMSPFSSLWEFWASDTSSWRRFEPSSNIQIEAKWQESERSKLFNQQNGLAGFRLNENNSTFTVLFATEGLQNNLTTNFIRGVRRRSGRTVNRTVQQGPPALFYPRPITQSAFQLITPQFSQMPSFFSPSNSPFSGFNFTGMSTSVGGINFGVSNSPFNNFNVGAQTSQLPTLPFGNLPFSTLAFGASLFSLPSAFQNSRSAHSYDPAVLIPISDPEKDRDCSICADSLTDSSGYNDDDANGNTNSTSTSKVVKLSRCRHYFHIGCIKKWFKQKPSCPECMTKYGFQTGTQPTTGASMDVVYHPFDPSQGWEIDGFPNTDVIEIIYRFQSGMQGLEHPHPGAPYTGTVRNAYLPKNSEGEEILRLLKRAWDHRLIFRVGRSVSTGQDDCVVWGGIHHKTRLRGGSTVHGYPDSTYFSRVKRELADLGIV